MFLSKRSCGARLREAENARKNRREIVSALSQEQITRRDLMRWGMLTASGLLMPINGLSKWATSAYAAVPTGTPRSPSFGAAKFSQPMPRPAFQTSDHLIPVDDPFGDTIGGAPVKAAAFPHPGELPARRLSYHDAMLNGVVNPVTGIGPYEGRPPGEFFAHQRWQNSDLFPTYGYTLSLGQVKEGSRFHPSMPDQDPNAVWSFGKPTATTRRMRISPCSCGCNC